jgi:hypothetical protein
MFNDWNDDIFAAWFAGFLDGEGCIYLSPRYTNAVEISISNTVSDVIYAIRDRLGFGTVFETTFAKPEVWKNKYTWRARRTDDCIVILRMVLPYTTIKKNVVLEAINRIEEAEKQRDQQLQRNLKILEMVKGGMLQREVAVHFGLSRSLIGQICRGKVGRDLGGKPNPQIWNVQKRHVRTLKTKSITSTTTKILVK